MFSLSLGNWESPESFTKYDELIPSLCLSSTVFERADKSWHGEWIFESAIELGKVLEIFEQNGLSTENAKRQDISGINWLAENYKHFKPINIGLFFIYGSHDYGKIDLPEGKIHLLIDASTAFGSGAHATTAGCLNIVERYASPNKTVLDMGCGSGILSVALAKMGTKVIACDNDEEAVKVTIGNAQINGVSHGITVCCGDGFCTQTVINYAPYNLIFANILAEPLTEMAADLCSSLTPDGIAVLSGITNNQKDLVKKEYSKNGVLLIDSLQIEEWVILVFKNARQT